MRKLIDSYMTLSLLTLLVGFFVIFFGSYQTGLTLLLFGGLNGLLSIEMKDVMRHSVKKQQHKQQLNSYRL